MTTTMKVVDKATGAESTKEVTVAQDEGIRADTTYEGVVEDQAGDRRRRDLGRQRQPVLRRRRRLRRDERRRPRRSKGLKPLGVFRGFAVAGCEPNEMGIGPVFAVPKLLEAGRH